MKGILTADIARRAGSLLKIFPEMGDKRALWSMFNDGGVECETGEFLYGLVRMQKPAYILETGTHKGISAAYMGQALKDNGYGQMDTIEWESVHVKDAKKLLSKLNLNRQVKVNYMSSADFMPEQPIDILFLDTEPFLRFGELLQFFERVRPGGFILIHDLHDHMQQIDNPEHGFGWPYGEIPQAMSELVETDQLRAFHFNNPRGLTAFYKPTGRTFKWR